MLKKTIFRDLQQGRLRPAVPAANCCSTFLELYNFTHRSLAAAVKLVTERFEWFGAKCGVHKWSHALIRCQ